MRRSVLPYLACPTCAAGLVLSAVDSEDDQHVMTGRLSCSGCAAGYQIRGGVPLLVTENVDPVKTETAARFAEEWTRWTDLRHYYEKQFLAWVAPIGRDDFAGQIVFEGGCGKGRHTDLVARFGAKAIVSMDLGESAFVAFQNTRHLPNAHIILGDLTNPPVKPVFDLAFSVGVLHHMPHPEVGARSVAGVVRDGGRLVYWVYGLENNQWITRFVDPVRRTVTSKIPYRALRTLSAVPAAAIFAAIKLFYRPGPDGKGPARLPYGEYFSSMYDFPYDELELIVFDQLVTPVAYYLAKGEVEGWFAGGGFRDVELRWHNKMSWTATATVQRAANTATQAVNG
ncbi:MAG: class I SAM-dependent methyltransferase [Myxococcales bacterium]